MARHHDLVIIGTGSGNSLITPELEGLDIALIEEGIFGGTCINVGCIPTKMFVLPADRVIESREAGRLGLTFDSPRVDWPGIRDRIFADRIDPISVGGRAYRDSQDFVTVYAATARFTGDRRLLLSTGEEITGERIVIAAGSRASMLDIDGLDRADPDRGVHTSDTVMRIEALPPRMAIIGGGFIAAEFAHVFSALGVEVTVIQRSPRLLMREDEQVSQTYTQLSQARHAVLLNSTVTDADRGDDGVWSLTVDGPGSQQVVDAELVLVAVGRTPNSDRLDVAAAGIETDDDDVIIVDEQQRTSATGVWALGDIANEWQLKHVANHEARVVAHNVAVEVGRIDGEPTTSDHRFVPHAVFGHPQVAAFGLTRAQLEESGTAYTAYTQKFGDTAYGWALEDTTSFLTVYADPSTGLILAAHCLGPHASTLIQPLIQAASFGQNVNDVARHQYWIHPALAEVVENALLGLDVA